MIDYNNYYYSGVDARFPIINYDNSYYSGLKMRCEIQAIIKPKGLQLKKWINIISIKNQN